MQYIVRVVETVTKDVLVEASNENEAIKKANEGDYTAREEVNTDTNEPLTEIIGEF